MPLPFTDLLRFIAARSNRSARTPAPSLSSTSAIGTHGERAAADFPRRRGYKILYRNFRTERGEIDLVCRHGEQLVFVEVRTRADDRFGRPVETIGPGKQERLIRAAARYRELLDRRDVIYRYDAVEVILNPGRVPACTLIEHAFTEPAG